MRSVKNAYKRVTGHMNAEIPESMSKGNLGHLS